MTQLQPGDTAPAFTLLDADQRPVSLADFAGGRVIVYFYPAAMTPGCTIQAVDFDAALRDLAEAGYQVVGISPDSPEKLARFREMEHLGFPLLADPDREVLQGLRRLRVQDPVRQGGGGCAALDVHRRRRRRRHRQGRPRAVQRAGHRPRRQAAPRPRRVILALTAGRSSASGPPGPASRRRSARVSESSTSLAPETIRCSPGETTRSSGGLGS